MKRQAGRDARGRIKKGYHLSCNGGAPRKVKKRAKKQRRLF